MELYRKKPIVIEATQWLGKWEDIRDLFPVENAVKPTEVYYETNQVLIHTLEGIMRADLNDWIIKGVNGECYPCKPDIFEKTYEKV